MLTDLLKLQADLLSARAELAASVVSNWILNKATPTGGGNRPVVSFPGFLGSGNTLLRLNRYLNRHGFEAQSWGQGRNLGPQGMSWSGKLDMLVDDVGTTMLHLAGMNPAHYGYGGSVLRFLLG